MKVATIIGARPQFVKAGVVSRVLRDSAGVTEVMIHTGQHYDDNMSSVFFEELDLPRPQHFLGIGSGPHGKQTGRMLEAVEQVLLAERPDWVLVYGDTNSTLSGALAAAKLHISVAHVEAGLRSYNRRMPEEVNRVITDHLGTLLFAPTATAVQNLAREGVDSGRVHLVGDVMYDAAIYYGSRAELKNPLGKLGLRSGEYILATIHRAENTDDENRLRAICDGLGAIAERLPVILPLHPRTRAVLEGVGWAEGEFGNVTLTDPLSYLEIVSLERHARLIVTDSGGVQKEAYFHGVPCVTLRDETEWVELVTARWNRLVPPSSAVDVTAGIVAALAAGKPDQRPALYGNGDAGERIVAVMEQSG